MAEIPAQDSASPGRGDPAAAVTVPDTAGRTIRRCLVVLGALALLCIAGPWFSRYGACRACGFRTVEGTTTVLDQATTSSEGRKRIDYHCHNCGDNYSVEHAIPRRSDRSSSGSRRSSFGGGRSSGGGASGRW